MPGAEVSLGLLLVTGEAGGIAEVFRARGGGVLRVGRGRCGAGEDGDEQEEGECGQTQASAKDPVVLRWPNAVAPLKTTHTKTNHGEHALRFTVTMRSGCGKSEGVDAAAEAPTGKTQVGGPQAKVLWPTTCDRRRFRNIQVPMRYK